MDACFSCSHRLYELGWHVNNVVISLSTWVDNLWSVSSNPHDSCAMISLLDKFLQEHWGVWLGEDSM